MSARLARVLLLVVLLAAWQAALEHPIEHANHEASVLCDALAALAACAPAMPVVAVASVQRYEALFPAVGAPRPAEAPPFLSQGPPASA